jgi:antitoxin MazE
MVVQIAKIDGQLAIPLPRSLANEAKLLEDSSVFVSRSGSTIVVAPIAEQPLTIEALVADITDENSHHETNWGPPVGKEVW